MLHPLQRRTTASRLLSDAGTYTITETGPGGYAASFTGDADEQGTVILAPGDDKHVLVTNSDFDPTITVCKVLINDDSGRASITDWTFVITDSEGIELDRQSPTSEEEPCVSFMVPMGTYTITEEGPDGYIATFSGDSTDGTISVVLGDSKTVRVTNDDIPTYTISGHKYCCGDDGCTGTGIEGWEVTRSALLDQAPPPQQTTLTGADGSYEFTDLVPGTQHRLGDPCRRLAALHA